MIGTLINVLTIIVGSCVGMMIGHRFPPRIRQIIMQVLGMCTFVIGVQMALKSNNFLIVIISLVLGALIGEGLNIDYKINFWGEKIAQKINKNDQSSFAQGFLTTTLLFCVGAMSIIGAIQEGLEDNPSILLTKAVLDGVSAIFFSATFGWGVLFSFISVLLYQGTITLLAQYLAPYITLPVISELTGTGGVILIGIALSILEIKEIRTANLIPAIPLVILLTLIAPLLTI